MRVKHFVCILLLTILLLISVSCSSPPNRNESFIQSNTTNPYIKPSINEDTVNKTETTSNTETSSEGKIAGSLPTTDNKENEAIEGQYVFPESEDNEEFIETPIYGIDSIIAGKTYGLYVNVDRILQGVTIAYDEDIDQGPEPDIKLMNCIETNPKFESIKKITNTKYSVYSLDRKLGSFCGKYTMDYEKHCYDYIVFDSKAPEGLFVSGDYNHIPRPINVFINTRYNEDLNFCEIQRLKEFDDTSLVNTGREILGSSRDIVIAQYFECDLNNDGKVEKIVNYNNLITDPDASGNIYGDSDDYNWQTKYYSVIAILDEKYNVIDFIHKRINLVGIELIFASSEGEVEIAYINDLDLDGCFEIISSLAGYEWNGYMTSKINDNKVTNFYKWYFW